MSLSAVFLDSLRENYDFPDYILVLLKVTRYSHELAVKKAFKDDPTGFLSRLEEAGKTFMSSDYPEELKIEFHESCKSVYINSAKFRLPDGDRDLIAAVFEKLVKGSFGNTPGKKRKRTYSESDPSSTFFNDKNISALKRLIINSWKVDQIGFEAPEDFIVKEISRLIWSIKCSECENYTNVQLKESRDSVNFNKGNFVRHLKTHNKKHFEFKGTTHNSLQSESQSTENFSMHEDMIEKQSHDDSTSTLFNMNPINSGHDRLPSFATIPVTTANIQKRPFVIAAPPQNSRNSNVTFIPSQNLRFVSSDGTKPTVLLQFSKKPANNIKAQLQLNKQSEAQSQIMNVNGDSFDVSNLNSFLKLLFNSYQRTRFGSNGNRYDAVLLKYCVYQYMMGGPLSYETWQKNLQCIPCCKTVRNNMNDIYPRYIDGHLYIAECKEFLVKRNLPLVIAISEDATRIVTRIEYDASKDQCVGFVAPIDENGKPYELVFPAQSAKLIVEYFQRNTKANNAILIMAQPIQAGTPCFVVGVIPTDCRFEASSVKSRWNFLKSEFAKIGVNTISFASDGDSRYLKTMKNILKFGIATKVFSWTCPIDMTTLWIFFQDPPHKVNNMKNRFCNLAIDMRMGKYLVTVNHLILLIQRAPKNQHLLNASDLGNNDKMNYKVIIKMSNEKTLGALWEKVKEESRGTIVFLRMLRNLLDAFTQEDMKVEDRVYKAFLVLMFFRIWRYYCLKSNDSNLENFVSPEAYQSIEINVWCLLKLIFLCRDRFGDRFFLICLMNSQICEHFFRLLRSNTSTLCTMVNFSPLELLERVQRFHIQEEILHDLKDIIVFRENLSRFEKFSSSKIEKMPSNQQLAELINSATTAACDLASSLGILFEGEREQATNFHGKFLSSAYIPDQLPEKITEKAQCSEEIFEFNGIRFLDQLSDTNYFEIIDDFGNVSRFKKSVLIWLLNEKVRVSPDRLKRYIYPSKNSINSSLLQKPNFIKKGDFVVINDDNNFILGEALNFRNLDKDTQRERKFIGNVCPVLKNSNVGVLASTWYLITHDGDLLPFSSSNYFNIQNYQFHVSFDEIDLDEMKISDNLKNRLFDNAE